MLFSQLGVKYMRAYIFCFLVVGILMPTTSNSEPFSELLPEFLANDESIKSARLAISSSNYGVDTARAGMFPDLSITVPYGYERQIKDDAANSSMPFYEVKLKLSQTVLDFGKGITSIKQARTGVKLANLSLKSTINNKIFEALSAYLGLISAVESLGYARQSEQRIMQVTQLEDSRVQRGGGLATNVLQAKAQLAGARAGRVNAEGALVSAVNRYRSVFKKDPGDFSTYTRPSIPMALIPATLEEAIEVGKQNNIDLAMSGLSVRNAAYGVDTARDAFLPTVKATAEMNNKRDSASVTGTKIEHKYQLELSYPITIGGGQIFFKERAGYKTAVNSYVTAKNGYDTLNRSIEESVRNAWQGMRTSRSNAEFLRNQANISGEFFDMAMKEVQLGNRQLIDVLSAETGYIGAISGAVSAQNAYQLAAYQLLMAMGYLTEDFMLNQSGCLAAPSVCLGEPPDNPMRDDSNVPVPSSLEKKDSASNVNPSKASKDVTKVVVKRHEKVKVENVTSDIARTENEESKEPVKEILITKEQPDSNERADVTANQVAEDNKDQNLIAPLLGPEEEEAKVADKQDVNDNQESNLYPPMLGPSDEDSENTYLAADIEEDNSLTSESDIQNEESSEITIAKDISSENSTSQSAINTNDLNTEEEQLEQTVTFDMYQEDVDDERSNISPNTSSEELGNDELAEPKKLVAVSRVTFNAFDLIRDTEVSLEGPGGTGVLEIDEDGPSGGVSLDSPSNYPGEEG